jgi:NAD(P)-dependent dehydrogenase (short-subunit alcohol dehydrogenase family)
LVALFVGATSGIGEETLRKLAQYSTRPRAYFVGRSQESADRIITECKTINPGGQYIFRKANVSLIRVVDEVCEEIKAKEQAINVLFLSSGVPSMDRSSESPIMPTAYSRKLELVWALLLTYLNQITETSENVHLLAALNYYSRIRFITNLLPLIQRAPALRRVVTVGGGGHESELDTTDFPALQVPRDQLRGHLTSLVTLGLEAVAQNTPDVSFVHNYPGTVRTKLLDYLPQDVLRTLTFVPLDESGERQLYMATSARYPPASGMEVKGVPLGDGVNIALGTSGGMGSGMYSVGADCGNASPAMLELLASMRERGLVQEVWRHTEREFHRITGEK